MADPLQQLVARAHSNFREFYRALALATPHGAFEEADGLALISTGLPLADVNLAIASRHPNNPVGAIERARAFYQHRGVPWKLYLPDEIGELLAPLAREAGLQPSHTEPGMLLTPLDGRLRQPGGLKIEIVDNPDMLSAFCETAAPALETTPDVFRALFDRSIVGVPDLTLYLGQINGQVVATSARFTSQRIAGVYAVSTTSAYRRRGIGEVMTRAAALGGREEGAIASALQSWPMAYRLYSRMGYRHLIDYHTWTSQTSR